MTATTDAQTTLSIDPVEVERFTVALVDAGPDEADVVAEICRIAADLGLETRVVEVAPGRPNVEVVVPGGTEPGLLFLGHSDVVPAGDGWTGDPYRTRLQDGRMIGRGTCDMKGGLAAVLAAMSACVRAGVTPAGPVMLACVVDEEEDGLGIRSWITERHDSFAACVVAEPTDGVTIVGCRGAANLEITVTGHSAHAGRPEDGRNAIVAAARIVDEIAAMHAELAQKPHPVLGAGSWNVGRIDGGTGPSIVAGQCRLHVDRRLLPDESIDTVVDDLRSRLAAVTDLEVEIRVEMDMPGFVTDPNGTLAARAMSAVSAAGAADPTSDVWTASCDGGFVARDLGVPTIVLGPGDLRAQAHQPDESVSVDETALLARAYAELMVGPR
ncbi:MAG: M20 family metallopeptidase [Rhodococcus sp. (in: high G+C Gram-positive bacteria)]